MVKKENIIKRIYGYPGVAVPTDYNIKYDDVSEKAEKDCVESFGLPGKILFISKSDGEKLCKEKDEKFVSNANIFMENCKVWHGDFILS